MNTPANHIYRRLSRGIATAAELRLVAGGISAATLSRTLRRMADEVIKIGRGRATRYARRGGEDMPVYRIDEAGEVQRLGQLAAVAGGGYVMQQAQGNVYSDGLPWWLNDMRPQGYLGRAWVQQHGDALDLPPRLADWQDGHILRALMQAGDDLSGNLLLGDAMRQRYQATFAQPPIPHAERAAAYAALAARAASGDVPGSSAAGEQPKFTAYAETDAGARHVIVKFSELPDSAVSERWRDLLLAEHLALQTLAAAGIAVAQTAILDHGGQRFLEVQRFDRIGARGRLGLFSLTTLDAAFAGQAPAGWPVITRRLAREQRISGEAADAAARLWAFGELTGNSDMHKGNLSFLGTHRPYGIAPAYNMTPMAFAPKRGGGLRDTLPPLQPRPGNVAPAIRREMLPLARNYLSRLAAEPRFSPRFRPCIAALAQHIETAARLFAD